MEKTIKKLKNLDDFIAYLKETDDDEWVEDIVRTKGNDKNCVMGHLVNWMYGKDYEGSIDDVWWVFQDMWATSYMVYPVNDGRSPDWMNYDYDQETPKKRVISYLENLNDGKEKTTQELMEEHKNELNQN